MKQKNYKGYKSFQYLEPVVDYKPFKLAKEIGRVEPYVLPVTPDEERQAQQILDEDVVISLHDHCYVAPEDLTQLFDHQRHGRNWTGFEALSLSGIDILFENFMDGTAMITSQAGWKWTDVLHDLGIRLSDLAHQDMMYLALTYDDLIRAKKEGKIAMVATIESATQIENEVDRVDVLYGFGVRCMGITYSESNSLGSGLKETRDGGLTSLGRQVVRRMNKLGMTIDTAHCGDQTTLDVVEHSDKPVFCTHIGARALWNISRLKPDDVLKAIAAKGGVIGIEAAPHTTLTNNDRVHSIEPFMEHFEYVANLVGIDNVAFGPDTHFGDHVGLHRLFSSALSISAFRGDLKFDEVEYVKGLENPAECFPNIVRWLVKRGYSREDIKKVLGLNSLRVLKETWAL